MEYDFKDIEIFMRNFYGALKFVCAVYDVSGTPPVINKIEWRKDIDREAYYFFSDEICDDLTEKTVLKSSDLIMEAYGFDMVHIVDSIFFNSDKGQRDILAKRIMYMIAPALCCKYFKISDFASALSRKNEKEIEECITSYTTNGKTYDIRHNKSILMFLNGTYFLQKLGRIFTDYGVDVRGIYETMGKSVYFYGYELLPDVGVLPDVEALDWGLLGLKLSQTDNTELRNNIQGETRKKTAGATAKVQCDVLTALLRAGNFDIPDNKKLALFISWLCGGSAESIRQRGFCGELSAKDIENIKEACGLIGLKYEKRKITKAERKK